MLSDLFYILPSSCVSSSCDCYYDCDSASSLTRLKNSNKTFNCEQKKRKSIKTLMPNYIWIFLPFIKNWWLLKKLMKKRGLLILRAFRITKLMSLNWKKVVQLSFVLGKRLYRRTFLSLYANRCSRGEKKKEKKAENRGKGKERLLDYGRLI